MKRRTILTIVCCVSVGLLSGCFSMPAAKLVKAYPGNDLPAESLSSISFKGSGFPDIELYYVDGLARTKSDFAMVDATYTDAGSLGFNVSVRPGEHVLQFFNVHKTPFDREPLHYMQIKFETEAGKKIRACAFR